MSKFQVHISKNECHVSGEFCRKRTCSWFTFTFPNYGIHYQPSTLLFVVDLFSTVTFGIISIRYTFTEIASSYRQFMLGVNVIFKHLPRKLLSILSRTNYSTVYKSVSRSRFHYVLAQTPDTVFSCEVYASAGLHKFSQPSTFFPDTGSRKPAK